MVHEKDRSQRFLATNKRRRQRQCTDVGAVPRQKQMTLVAAPGCLLLIGLDRYHSVCRIQGLCLGLACCVNFGVSFGCLIVFWCCSLGCFNGQGKCSGQDSLESLLHRIRRNRSTRQVRMSTRTWEKGTGALIIAPRDPRFARHGVS